MAELAAQGRPASDTRRPPPSSHNLWQPAVATAAGRGGGGGEGEAGPGGRAARVGTLPPPHPERSLSPPRPAAPRGRRRLRRAAESAAVPLPARRVAYLSFGLPKSESTELHPPPSLPPLCDHNPHATYGFQTAAAAVGPLLSLKRTGSFVSANSVASSD